MPAAILRILFITAKPEDQIQPDTDSELQAILETLRGTAFTAHYVFRATRERILEGLETQPDVVHFLGHGQADGLIIEDHDGVSTLIDAAWLVEVFTRCPSARVAVLNACESNKLALALVTSPHTAVRAALGWSAKMLERQVRQFVVDWYARLQGDTTTAHEAFGHARLAFEGDPAQVFFAERPPPLPPVDGSPFAPSNFSIAGIDRAVLTDLEVDEREQSLSTNERQIGVPGSTFFLAEQTDGSRIGVYVFRNVRIRPNASLRFEGTNAGALVAIEEMQIYGGVYAAVHEDGKSPGGFRAAGRARMLGGGLGAGTCATEVNAGAGGSYCGCGGAGASRQDGAMVPAGKPYGNPELVPLIGGSAGGGDESSGHSGGSGGGALQLVAFGRLHIGPYGYVGCGGGGGRYGGMSGSQQGNGGGSGGAVLIEAPVVEIRGIVAVNGGGGGASQTYGSGEDGRSSDGMATGGYHPDNDAPGGQGSGGAVVDGEDGRRASNAKASGGGGGAGRIRINTATGEAIITGTLSPALSTACTTLGKLVLIASVTPPR